MGSFCDRFLGGIGGLLPLLGFAIGIDHLLVAALGIVVAQGQHFAEGIDGALIVAVVAVDGAQALQENGPVILLALGVAAIGLLGFLQQVLQYLNGFVVTALGLVDGGDVVGDFDRVLHHGLGFFQIVEREVELAALAVDLGHAQ